MTAALARLLLLVGLFMMTVQMHRSLGAVLANALTDRGYAPADIATVVSSLFLASAVFQLPTGLLYDRYGARWTMFGLGLLASSGIVVFALADSVVGLSLGRFMVGAGHGGAIAGIYMLALNWVAADRVSTLTGGVVAVAGGLGGVLATAPLVFALERAGHQVTFMVVFAVTLLVTLAIGLFVRDAPAGKPSGRPETPETLVQSLRGLKEVALQRELWPLYAVGACYAMPFNAIGGLWSGPYLREVHGLSNEQAGLLLMAMVAAFHLGNLGYGPLERRFKARKPTVSAGLAAMIGTLVLLALFPAMSLPVAAVLLVLFCLCSPYYPVLAAHVREFVPIARAGRAIACVNLVGLGSVFAMQKISGLVVDAGGAHAYPVVFALVALALLVALVLYQRANERQSPFTPPSGSRR